MPFWNPRREEAMMTKWFWFWFSFSGDDGFIGALIIDGVNFMAAHQNSHLLGLNPGGELKSLELEGCKGPDDMGKYEPYRLYTKAEIEAIDGVAVRF